MNNKPKGKTIIIDPKIFIGKPFTQCPKCKNKESYGLLMVNPASYTKRCKECWYSENYKLPKLNKKIIYLDQFVISNMMKSINNKLGKKDKVDKTYLKLFEEIDKMVKLQLIVCPDSSYHMEESLLSFHQPLKRMYEHISHGITFYDPRTIRRFQITDDFKDFIAKKSIKWESKLNTDNVLMGTINEWQSKYLITVDSDTKQEEIDAFRSARLFGHEGIKTVFSRWLEEKNRSYDSFFKEIASSYGIALVDRYAKLLTNFFEGNMGITELNTNDVLAFSGEESIVVNSLLRYLPEGASDLENLKEVIFYLKSERLGTIPFNEIYTSVWSAIAYQASRGGRTTPPNIGMFNDVEMIGTLSPYCDAIFIDKDMYSILNFGEVKKTMSKYKARIFSLSNKDDFFEYLAEIKNKASKSHLQRVKDVYGDDWDTPFYEMYES